MQLNFVNFSKSLIVIKQTSYIVQRNQAPGSQRERERERERGLANKAETLSLSLSFSFSLSLSLCYKSGQP